MKHEKTYISFFTIVVGLCFCIFTGCQSTNYRPTDDNNGRIAISALSKLESQFNEFDRRMQSITGTATDIGNDLEEFEREFREYVKFVQRLRTILEEYGIQVERNSIQTSQVVDSNNSGNSFIYSD